MARTIAVIRAQILAEKNAQAALAGLDSPSQTAIYITWIFIQAVTINLFEQILDIFKADLETKIRNAAVGTDAWLQDKVKAFQYSATTPQVLEVDSNFALNYPTVDTTLCITTRCSVKTTGQRIALVKVAKSEPPAPFSGAEVTALEGYLSDLNNAGVNYQVISLNSDKIYIGAEIYYNGQYALVVQANVIAAINTYLANIDFNGKVNLLALEIAIKAVAGVSDVILNNVAIRADATLFIDTTYLVQNKTTIISNFETYAGYITEETESGYGFATTLTFIAQ